MLLLYVTSVKGLLILNKLYTAYITMWSVIGRHLRAASDLSIMNLPLLLEPSLKSMLVVYMIVFRLFLARGKQTLASSKDAPLTPHPLHPPQG